MKRDSRIFELIAEERSRQMHGIELIASENFVSDEVMEAMGSVLTNKYAEGYPAARYYGGCEVVDKVERLAIERICELYGAEWANVQPHSGAQANMAVFFACMQPGDTFMGLDLAHGGHLSHGSPVNMSGKYFKAVGYQLDETTGMIDYDAMERKALECRPKLIVGGASAYSREWDYKRMREIADKVGALLMVDMAHTAGLIAAGLLENPVKYAHIVTSTTHKTLRGPRGGIILMGKDFENPWGQTTPKGAVKMMSQILNSAVFPGIQGGPLEHVIAAKAVAFGEALQPEYREYQRQVQKNAAAMAAAFTKRGYKIVSGGTDNHLMLDGQAGREVPRGRRHHDEQEHGSVRHALAVPDVGSPLRYAGHHDARSERGADGLHRRTDRPGSERSGERGEHRRRSPGRERADGELSAFCLVGCVWRRCSISCAGCPTTTTASGSTPTGRSGRMSRACGRTSRRN